MIQKQLDLNANPATLSAFINSLFINHKSIKDTGLINSLAVKAINASPEDFFNLYKSLKKEGSKNTHFSSDKLRLAVLSKVKAAKEITPVIIDVLKIIELKITLNDLIQIKKKSVYLTGGDLLDALIKEKSPKNERVEALYSLMEDYKKIYISKEPLSNLDIKGYKEKINIEQADKTSVNKFRWTFVDREGKKYNNAQRERLGSEQKMGLEYKKVMITRNMKTQDQKDLEKIYSVFLQFLSHHLRADFVEMLDILDLEMTQVFEKMVKFNPNEATLVWQKFVAQLDIKSYYEGLKEKEKNQMVGAFNKIQASIDKNLQPKKKKAAYSYSSDKNNLFNCVPTKEALTQVTAKDIILSMVNMDKTGFSIEEIVDSFDIFESNYKGAWKHNKTIGEFLFNIAPAQITKMSKSLEGDFETLRAKWEKSELEKTLRTNSGALEDKINIKKYKI